MSNIETQKQKNLPQEFLDALEDLKTYLVKVPTKVRKVLEIGDKYGIDKKLVRCMIKQALDNVLAERTIYRYMQEPKSTITNKKENTAKLAQIEDNIEIEQNPNTSSSNNENKLEPVFCDKCHKQIGFRDQKGTMTFAIYCYSCGESIDNKNNNKERNSV